MLRTILLIGSGGFIGSVMRYLVQYYMEKSLTSTFPWGTLIANVAGSFIIGIVFALAEKGNLMSAEWRIFLAVGVCGGFTTFSAFAYNNFTMINEKAWSSLFLNTGGNLFLGILAVYLGIILIRLIF
ncbi:fluoride efflux transporter CrcB [Mariniphaga sp.]|uniref:fluoride efflux transporter CrcB n=1 Tax=Mariniphaga sp. TaxID=1954475 RepID=UPI00356241E8